MKQILILLSALMLLSFTACAKQQTKQGANQMQLTPDYGNKPSYRLNIAGFGDKIEVFFNGSEMFHDFSRSQVVTVYPINDYVTTGENELKVRLVSPKKFDYRFNPKGWFKVSLEVRDAKGSWQRLGGIVYDAAAKEPLKGSAHEGYYTLEAGKGYKAVALPAEAEVSKVKMKQKEKRNRVKINTKEFIQTLIFPTPFPRWKFLDSEDIVEEDIEMLTSAEYEKLRQSPKMQKLYDAYEEILSLLKSGQVDKMMSLFDERLSEFSYAWRKNKQTLKKELAEDFKEELANPEYEIVPFERSKKYFFIDENRKLAYIPGTVKFKKKGAYVYQTYNIKFRWDGNRWILTR